MAAVRTIPIDVKLALIEIPPNLRAILTEVGQRLQQLGRVRVAPPVMPREQAKQIAGIREELARLQEDLRTAQRVMPRWTRQSARYFEVTGLSASEASLQTAKMAAALGLTGERAREFAREVEGGRMAIMRYNASMIMMAKQMGTTGLAIRGLLRELFWLGLGSMFITMSWARMRRQQLAVERGLYSYRLALRGVTRAKRALNEAILEYGAGSEEAIEAQERYKDAVMRVRWAEESLRAQTEMVIYTQMMLWFGTVPTILRLSSELYTRIGALIKAHFIESLVTKEGALSKFLFGKASIVAAIKTALLNKQLLLTIGLTAALTGGIMLLAYVLSSHFLGRELARVEEEMRKLREEFGLTEHELTGGSLIDSIRETTRAYSELYNVVNRDFRPEFNQVAPGINVRAVSIGSIVINATIREEEDITRIRRAIIEALEEGISRRGGTFY